MSLHLKSKHIYELIYNRINNDLLLWKPSAPKPKIDSYENITSAYQNFDKKLNIPDTFGLCKSGIQYGKHINRNIYYFIKKYIIIEIVY